MRIYAGKYISFYISNSNNLYGWGYNISGSLGFPRIENVYNPRLINIPYQILEIKSGTAHTALLSTQYTLYTTGYNNNGQLGLGDTIDRNVFTQAATNVTSVDCGNNFTAFVQNGQLYICGQCNDVEYGLTPTQVSLPNNKIPEKVTCGEAHIVILCTDGTIVIMGDNTYGQYGNGTMDAMETPHELELYNEVPISIVCGYYHTMILCATGALYAFGANNNGQLGHSGDNTIPTNIVSDTAASSVACGAYHTCVKYIDGSVHLFGDNSAGQLGEPGDHIIYDAATINADVDTIACGAYHTLILHKNATTVGFGDNTYGQIGPDTGSESRIIYIRHNIPPILSEQQLYVGQYNPRIILSYPLKKLLTDINVSGVAITYINNEVGTWEYSLDGVHYTRLLYATSNQALLLDDKCYLRLTASISTTGDAYFSIKKWDKYLYNVGDIVNTGYISYGTFSQGEAECIIFNTGKRPAFNSSSTAKHAGYIDSETGALYHWGVNSGYQLGVGNILAGSLDGIKINRYGDIGHSIPVSVACGQMHTGILCADGSVLMYGANNKWQLGTNSQNTVNHPQKIMVGLSGYTILQIACGAEHTVFITDDGSVLTCGTNTYGQLGTAASYHPVPTLALIGDPSGLFAVYAACNQTSTLIVCSNGSVIQLNATGQPTILEGGFNGKAVYVANGANHYLVSCNDGLVYGYGSNTLGQLGSNEEIMFSEKNVVPVMISCGANHSAILTKKGELYTFGSNSNGQLGVNQMAATLPFSEEMMNVSLSGYTIIAMNCASYFTSVLCSTGDIFSFGSILQNTSYITPTPTIIPYNIAPTLSADIYQMQIIEENISDASNGGIMVRDFMSAIGVYNDMGIAITGADTMNGSWEYMRDGGFNSISDITNTTALLLDSDAYIRFVPRYGYFGSAKIKFKLWDESMHFTEEKVNTLYFSRGSFSESSAQGEIKVLYQNKPPEIRGHNILQIASYPYDISMQDICGISIADIIGKLGNKYYDLDPNALKGVAIVDITNNGNKLEYMTNYRWIEVTAPISCENALVLKCLSGTKIRINPTRASETSITMVAWDQTNYMEGTHVNATYDICGYFSQNTFQAVFTIGGRDPTPPIIDIIEIKSNVVDITWSPPMNDGGAPIKEYIVGLYDISGRCASYNLSGDMSSCSLSAANGCKYYIRLEAINECNCSNYATSLLFDMNNYAPKNIVAEAAPYSIHISWDPPDELQYSYILKYRSGLNGPDTSVTITDETNVTIMGLINNTSYTYVMYSKTAEGELSLPTLRSEPLYPLIYNISAELSAELVDNTVLLSWSVLNVRETGIYRQIDNSGEIFIGSTIDSYYTDTVAAFPSANIMYRVAGMSGGMLYTSYSQPVYISTDINEPDAPSNIIVTVLTNTSMQVSWDPPPNNGGARIMDYIITAVPPLQREYISDQLTIDISGINGVNYIIEVSARNSYNLVRTLAAAPVLCNIAPICINTTYNLGGTIPSMNTGISVNSLIQLIGDNYNIDWSGIAIISISGDWEYSIDELNDTNTIQIVDINNALLLGPTAHLRCCSAAPTVGRIQFKAWDMTTGICGEYVSAAYSYNGSFSIGSALANVKIYDVTTTELDTLAYIINCPRIHVYDVSYGIEVSGILVSQIIDMLGSNAVNVNGISIETISGELYNESVGILDENTYIRPRTDILQTITIKARGYNGSHATEDTFIFTMTVWPSEPAPLIMECITGNGAATISWQMPTDFGGDSFGHYYIHTMPPTSEWNIYDNINSYTISGLQNGLEYTIMFSLYNRAGLKTTNSQIIQMNMYAPQNIRVSTTIPTIMNVIWMPPDTMNYLYTIHYNSIGSSPQIVSTRNNHIDISNIVIGVEYELYVIASLNSIISVSSDIVGPIVSNLYGAPTGLSVNLSGTLCVLNWEQYTVENTKMDIYRRINGGIIELIDSCIGDSQYHDNIINYPNDTVIYQIVACNIETGLQISPFSDEIHVDIIISEPAPVSDVSVNLYLDGGLYVNVNWAPSSATNLLSYIITTTPSSRIISVDPGLTQYTLSGLEIGREYCIKIRALNVFLIQSVEAFSAPFMYNISPEIAPSSEFSMGLLMKNIRLSENKGIPISTLVSYMGNNWTGRRRGIAVTGIMGGGQGTWSYKLVGQSDFSPINTVSTENALLLNEDAKIRFEPTTNFIGNASIIIKAWDETDGIAGSYSNAEYRWLGPFSQNSCAANMVISYIIYTPYIAPNIIYDSQSINYDTCDISNTGVSIDTIVNSINEGYIVHSQHIQKAIAVVGISGSAEFQYYDGGWIDFPRGLSPRNGLLIGVDSKIRIKPSHVGSYALFAKAWNQMVGVAGTCVDTENSISVFSMNTFTMRFSVAPIAPGPPTIVSHVLNPGGTVTIYWEPPENTGGMPIENYTVATTPSTLAYMFNGSTRTHTLNRLQSGTQYIVRLTAKNSALMQSPTATRVIVMNNFAPTDLSATVVPYGFDLSWNAPDMSNNYRYRIYYSLGYYLNDMCVDVPPANGTWGQIRGLINGLTYKVHVTAIWNNTESIVSTTIRAVTPSLYNRPLGLKLSRDGFIVTLNWNEYPRSNKFSVHRCINSGRYSRVAIVDGRTYTESVDGYYGKLISYYVVALNNDAQPISYESNSVSTTIIGPPISVTIQGVEPGKRVATVGWYGEGPELSYHIDISSQNAGGQIIRTISDVISPYTITDLSGGDYYTLIVRATNIAGSVSAQSRVFYTFGSDDLDYTFQWQQDLIRVYTDYLTYIIAGPNIFTSRRFISTGIGDIFSYSDPHISDVHVAGIIDKCSLVIGFTKPAAGYSAHMFLKLFNKYGIGMAEQKYEMQIVLPLKTALESVRVFRRENSRDSFTYYTTAIRLPGEEKFQFFTGSNSEYIFEGDPIEDTGCCEKLVVRGLESELMDSVRYNMYKNGARTFTSASERLRFNVLQLQRNGMKN